MDTHNQQQFGSVEETDDVEYNSGREWFDYEDTTETEEERIANLEALEDEEAVANELPLVDDLDELVDI